MYVTIDLQETQATFEGKSKKRGGREGTLIKEEKMVKIKLT